MAERFPGHPRPADPLWRAIEVDPYLHVQNLYHVAAAYDPARAVALLIPTGGGPVAEFPVGGGGLRAGVSAVHSA